VYPGQVERPARRVRNTERAFERVDRRVVEQRGRSGGHHRQPGGQRCDVGVEHGLDVGAGHVWPAGAHGRLDQVEQKP
jgi:hypothetical protein